ncbi:MAG: alpha/beta fold hydrolase, partial [Candidatus Omnitrophota bacterium]
RWQEEYFSRKGIVMAPDLPGHGVCPWKRETLRDMAHGLAGEFDRRGIRGAAFIASSFGGLVALELWQIRPDFFRAITFAGSVPCFTAGEHMGVGLTRDRIHALGRKLEGDTARILEVFFRSLFTPEEKASPSYAAIKPLHKAMPVPSKEVLRAYLDILAVADLRRVLAGVTVPVQFIYGAEDYICPEALVAPLKGFCLSARVDVLPGCGHVPFISRPAAFNALVTEFTGL